MYDQLRNEYDSMKRSAVQPPNNLFSRNEPDLFANHAATMLDSRNPIWKGKDVHFKMTIVLHRLWFVPEKVIVSSALEFLLSLQQRKMCALQ